MTTCLVIDPHPMVRLGLSQVLNGRYEVEHADSRTVALDLIRDVGGFDLALLNTCAPLDGGDRTPTGTDAIRLIRRNSPATAVIALGAPAERHLASAAFKAGAIAYVSRSADPRMVLEAVEAALDDRRFEDPAIPPKGSRAKLTARQRQIVQLLADGDSTTAAARTLGLSEETVKTHMKNILARLGARNRAHAVAIALREALIE